MLLPLGCMPTVQQMREACLKSRIPKTPRRARFDPLVRPPTAARRSPRRDPAALIGDPEPWPTVADQRPSTASMQASPVGAIDNRDAKTSRLTSPGQL
jgi:hypothetical protein